MLIRMTKRNDSLKFYRENQELEGVKRSESFILKQTPVSFIIFIGQLLKCSVYRYSFGI